MMVKTEFGEFLKDNSKEGNEFRLVTNLLPDGTMEFYCHPLGRDGETYDGYAMGLNIYPKRAIENLLNYIRDENSRRNNKQR